MDVLDSIKEAIGLLKGIDEYYDALNGENGYISTCDRKIDYWEHYLEFEKLVPAQVYRIAKEIKRLRIIRRQYKNDAELIRLYKQNESKMQNGNHREILLSMLYKTDNKQRNATYSYSAYTEEERNEILGIERKVN